MELSEHRESLEELEESPPASLAGHPPREELDEVLRTLEVAKGRELHLEQQVERLERQLLEMETEVAAARLESRRAEDFVGEMRATLSWRVTAPLRAVSKLLRRP
jgi:hypothetical protein